MAREAGESPQFLSALTLRNKATQTPTPSQTHPPPIHSWQSLQFKGIAKVEFQLMTIPGGILWPKASEPHTSHAPTHLAPQSAPPPWHTLRGRHDCCSPALFSPQPLPSRRSPMSMTLL